MWHYLIDLSGYIVYFFLFFLNINSVFPSITGNNFKMLCFSIFVALCNQTEFPHAAKGNLRSLGKIILLRNHNIPEIYSVWWKGDTWRIFVKYIVRNFYVFKIFSRCHAQISFIIFTLNLLPLDNILISSMITNVFPSACLNKNYLDCSIKIVLFYVRFNQSEFIKRKRESICFENVYW